MKDMMECLLLNFKQLWVVVKEPKDLEEVEDPQKNQNGIVEIEEVEDLKKDVVEVDLFQEEDKSI